MPSEKARQGNRRRVQRWREKHREQYNAGMRRYRARKMVQRLAPQANSTPLL